jgi:hypothetical protein
MHQSVKKVPVKKPKQDEQGTTRERDELVVSMVLELLGKPLHYFGTTVRNVFDDKWRVNVWTQHWVSEKITPIHNITHSFFLTIQNGEIVCSNPPIIQLDEPDGV